MSTLRDACKRLIEADGIVWETHEQNDERAHLIEVAMEEIRAHITQPPAAARVNFLEVYAAWLNTHRATEIRDGNDEPTDYWTTSQVLDLFKMMRDAEHPTADGKLMEALEPHLKNAQLNLEIEEAVRHLEALDRNLWYLGEKEIGDLEPEDQHDIAEARKFIARYTALAQPASGGGE